MDIFVNLSRSLIRFGFNDLNTKKTYQYLSEGIIDKSLLAEHYYTLFVFLLFELDPPPGIRHLAERVKTLIFGQIPLENIEHGALLKSNYLNINNTGDYIVRTYEEEYSEIIPLNTEDRPVTEKLFNSHFK